MQNVGAAPIVDRQSSNLSGYDKKIQSTSILDDMLLSSVSAVGPPSKGGFKPQNNLVERSRLMSAATKKVNDQSNEGRGSRSSSKNPKEMWPDFSNPDYVKDEQFKKFLDTNCPSRKKDGWEICPGYMFLRFDRDLQNHEKEECDPYKFGEIVKAQVFFELYNSCAEKEIWLRLEGRFVYLAKVDEVVSSSDSFDAERNRVGSIAQTVKIGDLGQSGTQVDIDQSDIDIGGLLSKQNRTSQLAPKQSSTVEDIKSASLTKPEKPNVLRQKSEYLRQTYKKKTEEIKQIVEEQDVNDSDEDVADSVYTTKAQPIAPVIKNGPKLSTSSKSSKTMAIIKEMSIESAGTPQLNLQLSKKQSSILEEPPIPDIYKEGGDLEEHYDVFYSKKVKLFQFRTTFNPNKRQQNEAVRKGQYAIPFTIGLPKADQGYPPSIKRQNFGVDWTVSISFDKEFEDGILDCQREIQIMYD